MKSKGSENDGVSGSLGSVGSEENSLGAGEEGPAAALAKRYWTKIGLNPANFVSQLLKQSALLCRHPPKNANQHTADIVVDSLTAVV